MNRLQFIAIFIYIASLFAIFYFLTNKFEIDWYKKMKAGKYSFGGGFVDFRVIAIFLVFSAMGILKLIGLIFFCNGSIKYNHDHNKRKHGFNK